MQAEIIPGILQVEPYIRIIHAEWPRNLSDSSVEASVKARQERQKIFTTDTHQTCRSSSPNHACAAKSAVPKSCAPSSTTSPQVVQLPNVQLLATPHRRRIRTGGIHGHHSDHGEAIPLISEPPKGPPA